MDEFLTMLFIPLRFQFNPAYWWSHTRLLKYRAVAIVWNYSQVILMMALYSAAISYGWHHAG